MVESMTLVLLSSITLIACVSAGPVFGPDGPDTSLPQLEDDRFEHQDGDIVLTSDQYDMLFGESGSSERSKRKAWKGQQYRWTNNIVPYEFKAGDFTEDQKRDIRKAMDVYERDTCLKFRPATTRDVNKIHFLQGGGCSSSLGMVGGAQPLYLDKTGCRYMGLYWHEIGHAVGMVHEHQLPERDQFLKIIWPSVNPTFYSAFTKYKASELVRHDVPYDISSIMHYEVKAFSKDGSQTIISRDKSKASWIGNVWVSQMSFGDVMMVNKMYKCADRCSRKTCAGGFVNKECQCVTPRSYFDSHCVNEHPNEEECYDRAHKGDCDKDAVFMSNKCRKACGRCAMYGMDNMVKGRPGECFNQYFDDARCNAWAAAGDCEKYPSFMKRQCKKSCNECNGKFGKCLNTHGKDEDCDLWAKTGECERKPALKFKCADSCNTCGKIPRGKCENDRSEDECERRAQAGACIDDNPSTAIWMAKNCAATCNRCGFAKGQCRNNLDDNTCDRLALEGGCHADPKRVMKDCKKSCNSCDYGTRGNCNNVHRDSTCEYIADSGKCDFNPGAHKLFCPKSCNSCGFTRQMVHDCRDLSSQEDCTKWLQNGQCDENPGFTKYNCARTCRACHLISEDPICADLSGAWKCEFWKKSGECEKNPSFMDKNCKLTCNKCAPGERVVPDPGFPKCQNIADEVQCTTLAGFGACGDSNKRWMNRYCEKACDKSCA